MRLLRINGIDIDIDEQTAIGVDYQSYDVQHVGDTFIKITNTFTVPATINNLAVFGLPNNPQSLSTKVYEENVCDYWVNNDHIIESGKVSVQEIHDRISLFVFEKMSIWDVLKTVYFNADFWNDFFTWYGTEKGGYTALGTHFTGTFQDFCEEVASNTEGIILPMTFSNLYNATYDAGGGLIKTIERDGDAMHYIYLQLQYTNLAGEQKKSYGGHFALFYKTVFEYIEWKYDVNFLTSGGVLIGNIWNDPIASQLYFDCKDVAIRVSGSLPNLDIYFFYLGNSPLSTTNFLPYEGIKDKEDKTLYDFVLHFMQLFNCIKDEIDINGEKVIRLARFDDIETLADVQEFSGITGKPRFKPLVENYAQNNYIKFKTVYEGGDSLINSKVLTLNNLNLDKVKTLFEIDAHVPAVINRGSDYILDLSKKEAFKTFTPMISNGLCSISTTVAYLPGSPWTSVSAVLNLPMAQLYELDSEYTFLNEVLTYPKWYEIQKWLTPPQLKSFEFFKQYWIKELNGAFFINKIKGFNPDKSNAPVTLEVLRISGKTPVTPPDLNYWTDGVADAWTDGSGDYFY